MKRTTIRLLVLLACGGMVGCRTAYERAWLDAQQNLEPEPGVLAEYDSYDVKVRTLFTKAYERDVVFRMVCIPSFTPEWLVGIRETGETHSAFVLRPEKHIWKTELIPMYESGQIRELVENEKGEVESRIATNTIVKLKREVPQDFRQIKVTEKSEAIDAETARLLANVWSKMLLSARHPEQSTLGCDGVTYHFSMSIPEHGIASGKVWTPSPETRTGMLSSLGELVAAYVDAPSEKRQEILKEINRTALALQKKL